MSTLHATTFVICVQFVAKLAMYKLVVWLKPAEGSTAGASFLTDQLKNSSLLNSLLLGLGPEDVHP